MAIIRRFQDEGKNVGMIGDGINDAQALAASDVGFAIGTGTDIAIESADMTLVQGDITKVTEAIQLSTDTIKIIKQNLFWAFGYNVIAIPVAAMAIKATSATTITEGGLLMLTFGAGTLPTMLFVSVAFGKMNAHFRGLMLKSAALIMIAMGCNTVYMGMSFYVAENFQQHNFIHDIKNEIDAVILFLGQMVEYYTGMIRSIQGS